MEKPRVKDLVEAAGISKTYASDIRSDKQRPSRPLAIRIFRQTGWRHDCLSGLSDEQIEMLEAIEPWTPTPDREAAA